jgi:ubiquinone/menaquinone biosynthesis C-methylase UbiE
VLAELAPLWAVLPQDATLLDVGMGMGDIPAQARLAAARHGVRLTTLGIDSVPALAVASRDRGVDVVCADARAIPLSACSVDVVTCSQVLHHFFDDDIALVLRELDRVARTRVIVSDLRRSRFAAGGIWLASFALGFHPVSRHDGVVSVRRGFRGAELRELIRSAVGCDPCIRARAGFRVTATWAPGRHAPSGA